MLNPLHREFESAAIILQLFNYEMTEAKNKRTAVANKGAASLSFLQTRPSRRFLTSAALGCAAHGLRFSKPRKNVWSLIGPNSNKVIDIVENGGGNEDDTVETIQQSAMSGDGLSHILDTEVTLDRR